MIRVMKKTDFFDVASDDVRRIRRLLESGCDLRENELEAFNGMLGQLEDRDKRGLDPKLTKAQAAWLSDVAAREGVDLEPRGPVPRGREVATPPVLQHLPKKPPGFRRNGP